MRELIIENPKLQTVYQKYTTVTLTWVFWVIWVYIWTPLITLACWWIGIEFAYTKLFSYASFMIFLSDIQSYAITIVIFCAVLIFWAMYNLFRFRNASRYKEPQAVSLEDIGHYANIPKESLEQYQKAKIVSVRFDEQNRLVDIRELGTQNLLG